MKKECRYKLDANAKSIENILRGQLDVDVVIGCLLDNYRVYDTTLKWEDWEGKHQVYFDEVIILEEYVNSNMGKSVVYGIKYRGITEEEKQIITLFENMLEEQEMEF